MAHKTSMKRMLYIILGFYFAAGSCSSNTHQAKEMAGETSTASTIPVFFMSLEDAAFILGEPAQRSDSSCSTTTTQTICNYAFTANANDGNGKTGVVYFLSEQYVHDSLAHRVYIDIYNANKKNGARALPDLGDEAYFHSDNQNFYFIMVRKGTKMFRIKVNKITSHTSLDAFNQVAKKISVAL